MQLAAIDLVAALDKLLPSLTEEGREFPERLPSSLSLSLVTSDRVLFDLACDAVLVVDLNTRPDVLLGWLYTFTLNIVVVVGPVVSDLVVTLGTILGLQTLNQFVFRTE